MSLLGDAMGSSFATNFLLEINNAVSAAAPIGFTLLAVVIGWQYVKKFLGVGYVDGSGLGFTSASDYLEWCEDHDLDPDFEEEMEYMTEEEKVELFENSVESDLHELRESRLRGY